MKTIILLLLFSLTAGAQQFQGTFEEFKAAKERENQHPAPEPKEPTYAVIIQGGLGRIFKDDGGYKDIRVYPADIYVLAGTTETSAVLSHNGQSIHVPLNTVRAGTGDFVGEISESISRKEELAAAQAKEEKERLALNQRLNQLQQSVNDQAARTRQLQAQQAEIDWQQRHPR